MPRHDPLPKDKKRGSTSQRRFVPPDYVPLPLTAEQEAEIRRRQRARSIATALILFALVALFYAISIAKML